MLGLVHLASVRYVPLQCFRWLRCDLWECVIVFVGVLYVCFEGVTMTMSIRMIECTFLQVCVFKQDELPNT